MLYLKTVMNPQQELPPMSKIPQVAQAIQTVLTTEADAAAPKTGFTQRQSKLTGSLFTQTLVMGWLSNPEASLDNLAQTAASLGVSISAQGLDQRFSPHSAACLHQVLEAAVGRLVTGQATTIQILERFRAVYLQDSTTIGLPDCLSHLWPGGGREAAIKLQVRWDYLSGRLIGPFLQPAKRHDRASLVQHLPIEKGALRLADLGYFGLDNLKQIDQDGGFYLSRVQVQTQIFDLDGNLLDLPFFLESQPSDQIDCPVLLGKNHLLNVRLLAVRVPQDIAQQRRRDLKYHAKRKGQQPSKARLALCDWTILVTNAPQDLLSLQEALVLAQVRWQIELLFKLWKSHGHLDKSKSQNPWRTLTELYAKMIGLIIQHWIFLTGLWIYPNKSLVKAAQTVRTYAVLIACAIPSITRLSEALKIIQRCLKNGCRMNTRKKKPNTYQLLMALANNP
jgi:hypothetical protein